MAQNFVRRLWDRISPFQAHARYFEQSSLARSLSFFGKAEAELAKALERKNYWESRNNLHLHATGKHLEEYTQDMKARDEASVKKFEKANPRGRFSFPTFGFNVNGGSTSESKKSWFGSAKAWLGKQGEAQWIAANIRGSDTAVRTSQDALENSRASLFGFTRGVENELVQLAVRRARNEKPPDVQDLKKLKQLPILIERLSRLNRQRNTNWKARLAGYGRNFLDINHDRRVFRKFSIEDDYDLNMAWNNALNHHLSNYREVMSLLSRTHGPGSFARVFGQETPHDLALSTKTISSLLSHAKPTEEQLVEAGYNERHAKRLVGQADFSIGKLKMDAKRKVLEDSFAQASRMEELLGHLDASGVDESAKNKLLTQVSSDLTAARVKEMEHKIGQHLEEVRFALQNRAMGNSLPEPDWMKLVDENNASVQVQVGGKAMPMWRAIRERQLFTIAGIDKTEKKKLLAALPTVEETNESSDQESDSVEEDARDGSTYSLKQ